MAAQRARVQQFDAPHGSVDQGDRRNGGRDRVDAPKRLKASRFNVRAYDHESRLILYNSYSGAIVVVCDEDQAEALSLLRTGSAGSSELADELAEQGFLVPVERDELEVSRRLRELSLTTTGDYHLILMPTEECNFRCVYCYESFKMGKMLPRIRDGLKAFVRKRGPELDRLSVGWFGGEPLEAFDVIEELSHSFIESAREHRFDYRANITTNGYNLTPEIARKLLDFTVTRFQITIDGAPEDHDQRRVLASGGSTFNHILRNLQSMKSLAGDFSVIIRVNFDRESLARIPGFVQSLADDLASDPRFSMMFRPIGQWGGSNDASLPVCHGRTGEIAMFDLSDDAVQQGLRVNMLPYLAPSSMVCYAAKPNSLVVGANGVLYKCTVALDDERNMVGRLLRSGNVALNEAPFQTWVTADDRDDDGCHRCHFSPACQGAACPLKRMRDGVRPCPPVKNQIKRALRLAVTSGASPDADEAVLFE